MTSHELTVSESQVQSIQIHVPKLYGTILLFLQPTGDESGRCTLVFDGKAYTYYWCSMGKPLVQFLATAGIDYLTNKFTRLEWRIKAKDDDFFKLVMPELIEKRKRGWVEKDALREFYNYFKDSSFEYDHISSEEIDLLASVMGDEWYEYLPEIDNPEYIRFNSLIEAMQQGLMQHQGGAA